MRLCVTTEQRFQRAADGSVWTKGAHGYEFWKRYLPVFEDVRVIGRVKDVPRPSDDWTRAEGPGVAVFAIPYYVGALQLAARWPMVRAALHRAVSGTDAVIMRVPSFLANCLESHLRRRGHPYGLEVVGDPYECFAPGSIRHVLRPLLRIEMPRRLRHQCEHADGVAYVTRFALQQRYPCRRLMVGVSDVAVSETHMLADQPVFTTHYSSVSVDHSILIGNRTRSLHPGEPVQLVCVAQLEQFYKGHDILLEAVAQCIRNGLILRLTLVGDGKLRRYLERQACSLGIRNQCEFRGQVAAGAAVMAELDRAHIFVLPSRTEGLPRALIEAMARGLPCVATAVGGVPELLSPEDMVAPNDAVGLAARIQEVAGSPERCDRMMRRNLATAREYTEDRLNQRRIEFYRHIRGLTSTRSESA